MRNSKLTDKKIEKLVEQITLTYKGDSGINFIDASNLPVRGEIVQILDLLFEVLFPGHTGKRSVTKSNIKFVIGDVLCQIHAELSEQIERAYRYQCRIKKCEGCDCRKMAENASRHLLTQLPNIRDLLKGDVGAAFAGDPAAQSHEEVVISYPCIDAIATYRIAHELYLKQVPLIPRIMSECAHSKTGIDIHPGAKIGKNFFIDHGTGVVVGETSVIGENVRFYQGVSLIAISIPKQAQSIKGAKRHPTIEDDVTIYAEATLLGNITIGKGSVIGGNVWIGKSVPPGTTVSMAKSQSLYEHRKNDRHHKKRKKK
ncbi:MAG: serine O-acetyltransferase EpsC [Planctomycetota bacterium]|jgi:serine O-acetyltransferase